jgi:uncharacterized protein YabN with tetrapyrrole methylase and pyrophosphatase domain
MDTVSRTALPTLKRALRIQETAAAAGLDWPEAADVWTRINQELAEAKAASEDPSILSARIAARTNERAGNADSAHTLLQDELGDLLFAVVDVCRTLGVDPDAALEGANRRFVECFEHVQARAQAEGIMLGLEHPASIKALWSEFRRIQSARKPDAAEKPTNLILLNNRPKQLSEDDLKTGTHA